MCSSVHCWFTTLYVHVLKRYCLCIHNDNSTFYLCSAFQNTKSPLYWGHYSCLPQLHTVQVFVVHWIYGYFFHWNVSSISRLLCTLNSLIKLKNKKRKRQKVPKKTSAAFSSTDRSVSTGATAIVFVVVCFVLFCFCCFVFLFLSVLPSNLIGAEAISPNTHFVLCFLKFCLAWSTASCGGKINLASAPHFHCSPSESCLFLF